MNNLGNLTSVKFPVKMTKGREMWSHATFLTSNDRKISSMAKYILYSGVRVCNEFTQETFGRLTSVGRKFKLGKRTVQVFQCSCGETYLGNPASVRCGNTSSCGCLKREIDFIRVKTHGMSYTKENRKYRKMKERCYNPKVDKYPDYGGRGITVCDRWLEAEGQGFLNFLADMGYLPTPKHELDRKDVNGNYEPGNCRWATRKEQMRNTRCSRNLTHNGKTQCVAAWAEELGIKAPMILARLKYGWSAERTLTTPTNTKFRKGKNAK